MISSVAAVLHDLMHRWADLDYPHAHWWMAVVVMLVFVAAPGWMAWHVVRLAWRGLRHTKRRKSRFRAVLSRPYLRNDEDGRTARPPLTSFSSGPMNIRSVGEKPSASWSFEIFVFKMTWGLQVRLIGMSLLTLPAAWLLLEIPKHIFNHALSGGDGHPDMTFLGFSLDQVALLFALCGSYLAVLTFSSLTKYMASRVQGRVNERIVRRLRLAIARRARAEPSATRRSAMAAAAVQEVEPIGYFGGSLAVVPLIQGGTLIISLVFLLTQNVALALSALIMLPVQVAFLPRLQRHLNGKVRKRVHATRSFSGLFLAGDEIAGEKDVSGARSRLMRKIEHVAALEKLRVEISDLKARLKGLYNYSSNLTPFFFFSIGGYLVVQGKLSLGALVAALAAYKEIGPALRELFDFGQAWSDARARYEEVGGLLTSEPQNTKLHGDALSSSDPLTDESGARRLHEVRSKAAPQRVTPSSAAMSDGTDARSALR